MTIDVKAKYISKVEVLGVCPKGAQLKVWTMPNVKDDEGNAIQIRGSVDPLMLGFNLTSGGGVYLREEDVERV